MKKLLEFNEFIDQNCINDFDEINEWGPATPGMASDMVGLQQTFSSWTGHLTVAGAVCLIVAAPFVIAILYYIGKAIFGGGSLFESLNVKYNEKYEDDISINSNINDKDLEFINKLKYLIKNATKLKINKVKNNQEIVDDTLDLLTKNKESVDRMENGELGNVYKKLGNYLKKLEDYIIKTQKE